MEIPARVRETLEKNKVGYISVQTPSERISTNPVSYYFDSGYIYFMTPRTAKRYMFMLKKPYVTFTVDNGELMEKCAGIMVQGTIEPFSPSKVALSAKTILPKFLRYIAKYPEGIPFYVFGTLGLNTLPDERKIYKYNFIRLNPVKIFYWDGYDFGRIGLKRIEVVRDDPVLLVRQALIGDFSLVNEETPGFDILDVMNLSISMRRTALALATYGEAEPKKIAKRTNQKVSLERANLEALVKMGYAFKPEGSKVYVMEDR